MRFKLFSVACVLALVSCTDAAGNAPSSSADAGAAASTTFDSALCAIEATDYDRSCVADSDCRAVFAGDLCASQCWCPNAALNLAASDSYWDDMTSRNIPGNHTCPCPGPARASCDNGVCKLQSVAR